MRCHVGKAIGIDIARLRQVELTCEEVHNTYKIARRSTNSIGTYLPGQATRQFRVPGKPLYLKAPNCHCIDPNKDFVLNPKAWSDPAAGQWGTAATYYNDL